MQIRLPEFLLGKGIIQNIKKYKTPLEKRVICVCWRYSQTQVSREQKPTHRRVFYGLCVG